MNLDASPNDDSSAAEDVHLMLRVRDGDIDAFESLVVKHQHSVIGTVARMMGNPSDSEDIAQQVFIRVWKSAVRYEPSAKFTTWLMTITRNLVFNESRRRSRARVVPLHDDADDGPTVQYADPEAGSPADDLLDAELRDAVDTAIAELPEKHRLAIILRRYENMAYEEIAKVLKTSVPAVKSILFRARADLKAKLQRYME
jgi:RNA polymerase sigma-70 factor (ECF subfamily)